MPSNLANVILDVDLVVLCMGTIEGSNVLLFPHFTVPRCICPSVVYFGKYSTSEPKTDLLLFEVLFASITVEDLEVGRFSSEMVIGLYMPSIPFVAHFHH